MGVFGGGEIIILIRQVLTHVGSACMEGLDWPQLFPLCEKLRI